MPIYDYVCSTCTHQFEALLRHGAEPPLCPRCGGAELQRLPSLPAVKSEATEARAMRAARRRDQAQATERTNEQLKYERSHND